VNGKSFQPLLNNAVICSLTLNKFSNTFSVNLTSILFTFSVPLANLLSQVKVLVDTSDGMKPRDWIGSTFSHSNASMFTIIPELKRTEPRKGALRARYSPSRLVEEFSGVASSLSINSDGVVFGGSLDISAVRTATSLPILISDLILYPYQLYQLRLKGADAVSFIAAALSPKDLVYLTKIASSLGLQSVVSVTSEVQLERIISGSAVSIAALVVSNRNWEDFSVDESGQQALKLLQSDTMASFRLKFPDVPILVDGHVGLIQEKGSAVGYILSLKQAGARGAIVGSALAAGKISDLVI
jgi:indole-3-glycerol phosphate synthase